MFGIVTKTPHEYIRVTVQVHTSNIRVHTRYIPRGETRALIGGGEYSYIRVLPDEFLLKLTLMTADFKRNSPQLTL